VFAPGTPGQAYEVTRRALETAHKYQTPVIMLTDQYLADMQMNSDEHGSEPLDRTARPIDRCLLERPPADYLRYAVTPSGVSPRALPGSGAFVALDSDEHAEDGHITEDLEARVRLQDKRMAKYRGMTEEALAPERYGPAEAEHVLVCWGSTYGPCREAVDLLNEGGGSAAMVHFAQVWPVNAEAARAAIGKAQCAKAQCAEARKITVVEGNSTGQLASVLRERGVLGEAELMLRYDGMPFTGEEIMRRSSAPRSSAPRARS
jgi:2-oxoglutarate ferredoxin oxidoreductase subunit alpha